MRAVIIALGLALASCVAPTPPPAESPPSAPPQLAESPPAPQLTERPPAPTSGWATLREPLVYDGDTLYVFVAALPPELSEMSIRVRGIDAPEIRGDCAAEKAKAIEARDYARSLVSNGHAVTFENFEHDKYGGRVLADVYVDGQDLATLLIAQGLARPYDGGKRQPWC
jgi:micrococcal nuclease